MNKAIIIGNLGQKPELKFTQNGNAVTNFSLAVNEKYTDKAGNKQEKTEWVKIVVYGKQAESCAQYLNKGSQALVEGKISTRSFQDKSGGQTYVTEVIADHVQFL